MAKDLKIILNKLQRLKETLDADVPNHSYDSALAQAARAGGIEEAIEMIDRHTKGRRFKLDGDQDRT